MNNTTNLRQEINLLNRPKKLKAPTVSFTALIVCSLLSILMFSGMGYHQKQALTVVKQDIEKIEEKNLFNQKLATSPTNIEVYKNQLTGLEEKLLSRYQLWAKYKQITEAGKDGFSQYFYHIANLATDKLSLYEISISDRGNHLSLKGYASQAEEIPNYINALKSQEALNGVVFGHLSIEKLDGHSILMFSLDKQEISEQDTSTPNNRSIDISEIMKMPLVDAHSPAIGRSHRKKFESNTLLVSGR
ncbi:hypothetical protein ACVBE9_05770 [Eionea flava]